MKDAAHKDLEKEDDADLGCCNNPRIVNGISACMALKAIAIFGGFIFWLIEDWTFFESIWFSVTVMTTVGYGSFAPETRLGKIWLSLFAAPCIAVTPFLLNYTANFMMEVWTIIFTGKAGQKPSPKTT